MSTNNIINFPYMCIFNSSFNWNLTDSKSPQVSRTYLSILADLNSAVVSILPMFSNFSSLFSNSSGTVPSAPLTTGITVNLMFHIFCQFSEV